MSTKRYSTNFSSTVRLNVGGQYFTTTMQTLNKDPNSMLAAMFSGKFEMKPCEDGAFFIDRDGTHFRFILNFLRTGKLILPEGATFLKELEEEAGFYQNQGIIDALRPPLPVIQEGIPTKNQFQESSILKNVEHRRILRGWLPPQQQEGTWRLLFRASRDGFAANTFHSRCDNKGPTVTIAISINGFRFGGFTEESWTSEGAYKTCSQAFLFSIVNPPGLIPTKLPLINNQKCAIYCHGNYGPTFGKGDLFISYNSRSNGQSCSALNNSYECPPAQNPEYFFGGAPSFVVEDYEVFGL